MHEPTLTVTTSSTSYPVIVAAGAFADLPGHLANLDLRGRLWLISDDHVLPAYGSAVIKPLRAAGWTVEAFAVSAGEQAKQLVTLEQLYHWMISNGVERRDTVLALGGGVIGDLAGYAAATVLRGIAVVQLPTTLLAMVDAAVGGKTGINHALGKNLIGAFHQPRLVLADTTTLATLPPRELRAGWAEVIKHGVISDAGLFTALEDLALRQGWQEKPLAAWPGHDPVLVTELSALIRRAVAVKVGVVSRDEREQGERMTLNYGHTLGHAIENLAGYGTLLHGEAVAMGMHAAARIAVAMGLCEPALVERQRRLLAAYGLSVTMPSNLHADALLNATLRDKKVQARRVRWILPTALGSVVIRDDVPEAVVRAVLPM